MDQIVDDVALVIDDVWLINGDDMDNWLVKRMDDVDSLHVEI